MIILHSLFVLVGIVLIVSSLFIGEPKALIGGIVILAISAWNLARKLRKQTTIKKTGAEQVLDSIRSNKKIKL